MRKTVSEFCASALTMKKKAPITEDEKAKAISLVKLYGGDLFVAAVHGSPTANIEDIGQVCMQIGGYFDAVPANLSGIVLS
jgi:hypothetical protein